VLLLEATFGLSASHTPMAGKALRRSPLCAVLIADKTFIQSTV